MRCRGPNPPGDTRSTADFITGELKRRGLDYRIIAPHPEMPNIVATFAAGQPRQASRAQRPHRRVSRCRRRPRMDQGSLGRRARRWQNLRSRRRRHEVRHLGVDLDLHLSVADQGPPQGTSDPYGRLRRGDVRSLWRPLSHGAPPGGAWRRAPERRAVEPLQRSLRREGAAMARVHDADGRRARRLHARDGRAPPRSPCRSPAASRS